ncbi:hypothetical protein LZ30DRAFT_586093 [Colletotrichum cereale]|nr:hypothetical protein LZ30DRAFT_586093 [Colletotrichum cereale]
MKRSIGLDSYYRLPLYARFKQLDWAFIDPKVLLDDIHKGGNLEPADFRPVLNFSDKTSLGNFTWAYFRHLVWTGVCRAYPNGTSEEAYQKSRPWRDLARWVFGGLSVKDLSQMEKSEPLQLPDVRIFGGLVEWQYCFLLVSTRYVKPRAAQKAFLIWLEDVQASGIDLVEYGRQELEIYLTHGSLQGRRWFGNNHHATPGWKLASFTYGPEPRDWKFTWDLDAWEYAGDFWEQVENPPLNIPGAWVDDEIW